MDGARRYAELFESGQYGRLYICSSRHARGRTFTIQWLPEGVEAEPNGGDNPCLNSDAVEVYGIVGGHPGWTERYDWIYKKGPWVDIFFKMAKERELDLENKSEELEKLKIDRDKKESDRVGKLLSQ